MITLEKVNKYFNRHHKNEIHVINDTTLTFPDKGLVALLGPSGCGKTTLLNSIGGLDNVSSGNIYINNQKITKKCAYKKDKIRNLNIGYIFQNYYLVDDKTVFENVAMSLKMIGIKEKEEIKKRVNYVLETLGIYRYRNRPANMLSGGERQRVGIARAIVKNPNIIIADEPTGNLDSANTIEIMNIIKSISKKRLVILVTHENDIANFYADQIIHIQDGKIISSEENNHQNDLDYKIDNKIYLKDFAYQTDFNNEDNEINIYNDSKKNLKLTIVVKNNNIYIKSNNNQKIEVIESDSNIELINDHYKKIDKSIYEKYEFDFENIINKNIKEKYSSIINPITMIKDGFKKILNYSLIKKLLLIGFLSSGAFIGYSISNIFGIFQINEKEFVTKNKNYYDVSVGKILVQDYLAYEKYSSVDYIIPGSSKITFLIKYPFYYQLKDAQDTIEGSITSKDLITSNDLIAGNLPSNDYEIVVDKVILDDLLEGYSVSKMTGLNNYLDYLNMEVYLAYNIKFKIVGITDLNSPSIYINKNMLLYTINNSFDDNYDYYDGDSYHYEERIFPYELFKNDLKIKKGRIPQNDYETIVSINYEYDYPLNKEINKKINDKKLTVVGYYEGDENNYYVNDNTLKYNLITKNNNISIISKDKDNLTKDFNNVGKNIYSSYDKSYEKYRDSKKDTLKAGLIVCGIILAISFIEIYLMIRASFLTRIKEIGIYRAIGVKKFDIYKMFFGEIFAITTICCVPGVLFTSYCLKTLSTINYFKTNYLVNPFTILVSIIVIYAFNLIIGLLPVAMVVKDTPAKILSRKDLD